MGSNRIKELFAGRTLFIATRHKKEQVIAPVLSKLLNVKCIFDPSVDTDSLGTFTGEIERTDDVLETLRKKCLMGIKMGNCDIAVASEGSFGPHPVLGFVNADDEFLMFMDIRNKLEIVVRELSIKTNFNGAQIKTKDELSAFATDAGFPSHGLIIRKACKNKSEIIKGITDVTILEDTFQTFINKYGSVYVETDMRAMYNPTRMEVINLAAKKLAEKIVSFCPQCASPGFGVVNTKAGLPCIHCGFPTKSTLYHEYQCVACNYIESKKYPHGQKNEEPTFCDHCNP